MTDTEIRFAAPLRDWVLHNIERGIPPAPLARSMMEQGIAPHVAEALVQTLWSARASGAAIPSDAILPQQAQAARYRPQPARLAAGTRIALAEREIRVALRHETPALAVLDNVLSDEECEQLIALARPRLAASTIVDPQSGMDVASAGRSSAGMFFKPAENPLLARIDGRIAQLMQLPQENGEGLQLLHYGAGAGSAPHFDFLMPTNAANAASIARSGQRIATLVIYLNDVEAGGETAFPEAGITVAPRRGSALYFEYCNSDGQLDPLSLHAALPVLAGEKWVATKWVRQRRFVPAGAPS